MEYLSHRGNIGEQIANNPEKLTNTLEKIQESNEAMKYLQTKLQTKLEMKENLAEDDGNNEYTPRKRLGIFIAHIHKEDNPITKLLQENDINIYSDELLELHIPPQETSLSDIRKSFKRLQEYIQENQKDKNMPRYIYGVTYLAEVAKRWGFQTVELPTNIQKNTGANKILSKYTAVIDDEKKQKIAHKFGTEDIHICYISTEELLKRSFG